MPLRQFLCKSEIMQRPPKWFNVNRMRMCIGPWHLYTLTNFPPSPLNPWADHVWLRLRDGGCRNAARYLERRRVTSAWIGKLWFPVDTGNIGWNARNLIPCYCTLLPHRNSNLGLLLNRHEANHKSGPDCMLCVWVGVPTYRWGHNHTIHSRWSFPIKGQLDILWYRMIT